jgi:putative transcriptional regulator
MRGSDVKELRTRLGLSQAKFAAKFDLSLSSVRAWEQGQAQPDRSARVLLSVLQHSPEIVDQVVARTRPVG